MWGGSRQYSHPQHWEWVLLFYIIVVNLTCKLHVAFYCKAASLLQKKKICTLYYPWKLFFLVVYHLLKVLIDQQHLQRKPKPIALGLLKNGRHVNTVNKILQEDLNMISKFWSLAFNKTSFFGHYWMSRDVPTNSHLTQPIIMILLNTW